MLRELLRPPQLRTREDADGEERHATWLELFYDLVFVVAVAELAHGLSAHPDVWGVLAFIGLFVPVWWSWIGAMFYATRFDTDDIAHRILTLVQMAGVAALAVNVHDGLGKTSAGFALSYVAVRSILIIQYLRARHAVPEARELINWYLTGFGISAALWTLSVFVPAPWRFVMWGIGLVFDFGAPLTAGRLHVRVPPSISHVPERMGLFTIIVLGEAVAAVVRAVAEQEFDWQSSITALLGLSLAFSLWWSYFDGAQGGAVRFVVREGRVRIYQIWLYIHLPLAIGLTAAGVGVEHAARQAQSLAMPDADRWILCGAVAVCLVALSIVHMTSTLAEGKTGGRLHLMYHLVAAAFALGLGALGGGLTPLPVVILLAVACIVQVAFDVRDELDEHRASA